MHRGLSHGTPAATGVAPTDSESTGTPHNSWKPFLPFSPCRNVGEELEHVHNREGDRAHFRDPQEENGVVVHVAGSNGTEQTHVSHTPMNTREPHAQE